MGCGEERRPRADRSTIRWRKQERGSFHFSRRADRVAWIRSQAAGVAVFNQAVNGANRLRWSSMMQVRQLEPRSSRKDLAHLTGPRALCAACCILQSADGFSSGL